MAYRGEHGGGGRGGFRGGGDPGRGGFDGGRGGFVGGRGGFDGARGGFDRGRGGFDGGRGGFDRGRGGFDRGRGAQDRGRGGQRHGQYGRPQEGRGIFTTNKPAILDARLTDRSEEALIQSLNDLNLKVLENELPVRPGFGTLGRPVTLRSNFFPIKVPKGPLFEYDVNISPTTASSHRRMKKRIFQLAEVLPQWTTLGFKGFVAHDSSSKIISAKKFPDCSVTVPYWDEDEHGWKEGGKVFTLKIKFIQPLDTSCLVKYLAGHPRYRDYEVIPVIAALNIVLGAHANRAGPQGAVEVGKNRYFFPAASDAPVALGGGLEAFRGFYSSIRPTHNQLMVNVNVATTAFYVPGPLGDAMDAWDQASYRGNPNHFLRGLRVQTTHLGYRKTIKKLASGTSARKHMFDSEYGTVSVEQYFKKKYDITLRFPDNPLIDVGGQKQALLPIELCVILPNQSFKGRLLDDQTAAMIKVACKTPNINAAAIVGRGLTELGFQNNSNPLLNAFGIGIGNDMTIVPGRILDSPEIHYAGGPQLVDERAAWNMRGVRFVIGASLGNWAVVTIIDGGREDFFGADDPALKKIAAGFSKMCRTSGMVVPPEPPMFVEARLPRRGSEKTDPTRDSAIREIQKVLMTIKPKPSFIMFMLSNWDKHVYSGIKALCDSWLGVPTVCVQCVKIRKESPQYYANVALKVNMKMGGVNHMLDSASTAWLNEMPTMVVGMDVTHPGPGTIKGTPSVAAVVASVDHLYAQYPASMRIQETKKEMITSLKPMMIERLKAYQARNNVLPKRILVYRDGVSEGQFPIVNAEELPAMQEAFKSFDTLAGRYRPSLTIVICGKRHHTRFYPTNAGDADRDGNPKAGTVVDRGVTSVYHYDFFLQAHGGLQGTTRPTHYFLVHDEIGFQPNQIQALTNAISYTFARATRAVSLVAPAYYADLACERGRCYIHKLLQGHSSSAATSSSGGGAEDEVFKEAEKSWHGGVADSLKETMFYL